MSEGIIIKKLITEKTTTSGKGRVYAFAVASDATKTGLRNFLSKEYKVKVGKVGISNLLGKKVRVLGKRRYSARKNWKKAYVTLLSGDLENFGEKNEK